MHDPCFFGYGSLVNRATHDYPKAQPARIRGWRRAWVHTALRPLAFLSAMPTTGSEIDGLIATVPGANWAALDAREYAYTRHPLTPDEHGLPGPRDLQIYAVPETARAAPTSRHPIVLSYLDVVVQGFLREFGPQGVTRFIETTDGWDAPILNDRTAPLYPRAQRLTHAETALVDALLKDLDAELLTNPEALPPPGAA